MKSLFASLAIFGGLLMAPLASADSLIGTQVTLTGDLPTLGTAFTNSVTKTVDTTVEYPSGTLFSLGSGVFVIGVNIDVRASSINFNYTQSAQALSATFNGYVFDFDPATTTITGASLDPSSNYTTSQLIVGFSAHQVTVNAEGVFFSAGTNALIDLSATVNPQTSATPEPATYTMFLAGLGAVGICKRRVQQICRS